MLSTNVYTLKKGHCNTRWLAKRAESEYFYLALDWRILGIHELNIQIKFTHDGWVSTAKKKKKKKILQPILDSITICCWFNYIVLTSSTIGGITDFKEGY